MSCSYCGNRASTTCVERVLLYNTSGSTPTQKVPVPYGSEPMFEDWRPSHHCPECGVGEGNHHHEECNIEICPQCGEQLANCHCLPGVTEPQTSISPTD